MLKKLNDRLIDDWRWVATRAWSVRFMALTCVFECANAVLPRYETFFNYNLFSVIAGACTVAAIASRFAAQDKDM